MSDYCLYTTHMPKKSTNINKSINHVRLMCVLNNERLESNAANYVIENTHKIIIHVFFTKIFVMLSCRQCFGNYGNKKKKNYYLFFNFK